ncbi:mechanosensitive ion channel family protein [Pleurocapsales cyanobacterium LEGE 06147]|nr:mechanosensitive ion channel family protein [Pleurocapsales cyanobacterium LEGE 06147]
MFKKNITVAIISCLITITIFVASSVQAQLPSLQNLREYREILGQMQPHSQEFGCIRLDGRCLFKIVSTTPSELSERIQVIQSRFNDISSVYLEDETTQFNIRKQQNGNLWDIYIEVRGKERTIENEDARLLTITRQDAEAYGVNVPTRADQIIEVLERGFQQARQQRQPGFLARQGIIAAIVSVAIILSSLPISRWIRRLRKSRQQLAPSESSRSAPISTQLTQRQHWNIKEIQYRLLQLLRILLWGGGILYVLFLFPHTRVIYTLIIVAIRIPLIIVGVGILTYLFIRLSYALIARFVSTFFGSTYVLSMRANQRTQLRVNTITRIGRSVVTVIWTGIGILVAFSVAGVNVAPLLAGAGILGLAISLASQNLIKDAINGFFILLEDQYAVGDVIKVGEVDGLVENMNLRITQLRDAAGRLITVPNSEIRIVANLSSQWSRADLNIPIAYHTDVDKALHLISHVAEEMSQDSLWQEKILESPQVLGVDNFEDRGIIIKVWIKTEPLKQWEVSREFRRRIAIAFKRAGIPILPPQQQVWLNRHSNGAGTDKEESIYSD